MNVGIVSYYKISLIKESEGKFKRENGNRRWLQFYEYLASQNSQIELYESKNHNKYDVILIREIPRFEAILKFRGQCGCIDSLRATFVQPNDCRSWASSTCFLESLR